MFDVETNFVLRGAPSLLAAGQKCDDNLRSRPRGGTRTGQSESAAKKRWGVSEAVEQGIGHGEETPAVSNMRRGVPILSQPGFLQVCEIAGHCDRSAVEEVP